MGLKSSSRPEDGPRLTLIGVAILLLSAPSQQKAQRARQSRDRDLFTEIYILDSVEQLYTFAHRTLEGFAS